MVGCIRRERKHICWIWVLQDGEHDTDCTNGLRPKTAYFTKLEKIICKTFPASNSKYSFNIHSNTWASSKRVQVYRMPRFSYLLLRWYFVFLNTLLISMIAILHIWYYLALGCVSIGVGLLGVLVTVVFLRRITLILVNILMSIIILIFWFQYGACLLGRYAFYGYIQYRIFVIENQYGSFSVATLLGSILTILVGVSSFFDSVWCPKYLFRFWWLLLLWRSIVSLLQKRRNTKWVASTTKKFTNHSYTLNIKMYDCIPHVSTQCVEVDVWYVVLNRILS